MEHYYLFSVICCLLPFIAGGIWFAWHDDEPVHQMTAEAKVFPVSQAAEDLMLKEYYFDEFSLFNRFNSLLIKLKEVNLYDPQTRPADKMDDWFKKVTSQLMHDGSCLAYINHYGHLEDSFWLNIANLGLKPEQDRKFQQLLISINKTSWGIWIENFGNLLFHFGKNYQLLPEVESILQADSRFATPKQIYKFARECTEREKLKANPSIP